MIINDNWQICWRNFWHLFVSLAVSMIQVSASYPNKIDTSASSLFKEVLSIIINF